MNSLSLPIVHPAFQNLKRSGKLLHLTAAILILIHGITHIIQPGGSLIYAGCLFLIAVDILILLFAARNVLEDSPLVNLFFRFVEFIFFLGIGCDLVMRGNWINGCIHLVISLAYIYLFYCEKKLGKTEFVALHHTGITIPALPESKFFIWSNISHIEAHYDHIIIDTSLEKTYHFHLRKNLQFEELDQIHEFCRHYLQQR
ncbi:MAG: hypothetical protein EOO01_29795 [Chitinophagaceae bacterium]|nr:MAG: hypothetical protein EOO01_29795 [Chitinophagaceae bacterium]